LVDPEHYSTEQKLRLYLVISNNIKFIFSHPAPPKGTSLAENTSFDVLIDKTLSNKKCTYISNRQAGHIRTSIN